MSGPEINLAEETAGPQIFHELALDSLDRLTRYKLFMGSIIPRPIALVTSLDADGCVNLAPFSNFMAVSTSENLLAFSIGHDIRPDQNEKDTLRNIRANGELVINTAPCELARQIQASSKPFPPGVSEPEVVGLGTIPSRRVAPPRIAGTRVQFECTAHSIMPFGESHVVVAKVVLMHVDTQVLVDGKIDAALYQPLARLGGRNYCRLGDPVES
jgi:flavin reductase (DIM6/NTAB) family NADH-FMN oxidoreductase RutF